MNTKLCVSLAQWFLLIASSFSPTLFAQHFDVQINVEPSAVEGGRIIADPDGVFPVDFNTRRPIITGDFGDFAGGPHKTDDPGWLIDSGEMLEGEILWFRAMNTFLFWSSEQEQWTETVSNGERVILFGLIPTDVILGNDPVQIAFYEKGTAWTAMGIDGPEAAPIEQYRGGIHAHLDFCVQDSGGDCKKRGIGHTGNPSVGAYLIELQLFSDASVDGKKKYLDSESLYIVLNNGLSNDELEAAKAALISPAQTDDDSEALPAAGILIMTGH